MTKVTIIATGEELLNGSTVNSNSAFISRGLADLDFEIVSHVTVGDGTDTIMTAAARALEQSEIVLVTGGLGPTDDDNTVEALCRLTGRQSGIDRDAYDTMSAFFSRMGRTISEHDTKMAEVVNGSAVVKNTAGLAPGFIIETGDKSLVAMPGVPAEMEAMFTGEVRPWLVRKYNPREKLTKRITLVGMKESDVNRIISESALLSGTGSWGITVSSGLSTVTFFQDPDHPFNGDALVEESMSLFGDAMLRPGSAGPEEDILFLLRKLNMTLAAAESCTGGLVAKLITDVPGASAVFMGGVTAYSNESKTALLGVPAELISAHGAVSLEVAGAMAAGARVTFNADAAISTTGIAGPDGGTAEKPAGTVCFGFALGNVSITENRFFAGERKRVRERASIYAADRMRRLILDRLKESDN